MLSHATSAKTFTSLVKKVGNCCLLLGLITVNVGYALEGGSTSADKQWQQVTSHQPVDATTRQKELADRQQAIQDEIARLQARLKTTPSAAKMKELHDTLQVIHDNYGWEPQQGMIYGKRSIEPMLKQQDTMRKNLLAAFVQFNNDLQARGIDLIIAPMVPTPHFAAHTLVDGIEAEHDYYPGWTKMMIEMLENDIEIVDTTTEYRQAAEDDVLVSWSNDFHTGSRGREITAKAVAARLQRYDFARELRSKAGTAKVETVTHPGGLRGGRIFQVNKGLMSVTEWLGMENPGVHRRELKKMAKQMNNMFPKDSGLYTIKVKKGEIAVRPDAPADLIPTMQKKQFKYQKLTLPSSFERHTDLVLIGDSQLHSAVHGSGIPLFYMNEIGGIFRWGSKSWSGFSPPEIFLDVVPDSAVQPRVVVLSLLPKYFWHSYLRGKINHDADKYKPRPLPSVTDKKTSAVSRPITASVTIKTISTKPTNDPSTLDYDDALIHLAITVNDGPLKGQEIGLRTWILRGGSWTKTDGSIKVGQKMRLTMTPWSDAIKSDRKLGQHQVFDTVEQDLLVPVYWISKMP